MSDLKKNINDNFNYSHAKYCQNIFASAHHHYSFMAAWPWEKLFLITDIKPAEGAQTLVYVASLKQHFFSTDSGETSYLNISEKYLSMDKAFL